MYVREFVCVIEGVILLLFVCVCECVCSWVGVRVRMCACANVCVCEYVRIYVFVFVFVVFIGVHVSSLKILSTHCTRSDVCDDDDGETTRVLIPQSSPTSPPHH
jgi:hypothetical protein